jgi:hypothetical protein
MLGSTLALGQCVLEVYGKGKEQGAGEGYRKGYDEGYKKGYDKGFSAGHEEQEEDEEAYWDAAAHRNRRAPPAYPGH